MCRRLRSMILKTDLEARKRGLCEVLNQLQLVTQGALDPARVISDVAVFQKEAQNAVVRQLSADFQTMVPQLSREGRGWCPCFLAEGRRAPSRSTSRSTTTGETVPTRAQRCP